MYPFYSKYLRLTFVTLFGFLIFSISLSAQNVGQLKRRAVQHFDSGEYRTAYNLFSRYNEFTHIDEESQLYTSYCLFELGEIDQAEPFLHQYIQQNVDEKDPAPYFYYAEILAHRHAFQEAAKAYKLALKLTGNETQYNTILAKIKSCESGMYTPFNQAVLSIENMGQKINSPHDEIAPFLLESFGQDLLFYSTNHNALAISDHSSKTSFDIWTFQSTTSKSAPLINQADDDVYFGDKTVLGFNQEVNGIFYSQGGQLRLWSANRREVMAFPNGLPPIFPDLMDLNGQLIGDTIILFSSKRPGGFGGYDIYFTYQSGDQWSAPVNLGDQINTAFDEVDPFLGWNGQILTYASNRPTSVGGYDIYYSSVTDHGGQWSESKNFGLPVNSFADERGIQFTKNQKLIFISSNRKSGYGGFDIYKINLSSPFSQLNSTANYQLLPGVIEQINGLLPISASPVKNEKRELATDIDSIQLEYPTEYLPSIYFSDDGHVLNPQSIIVLTDLVDRISTAESLKITIYAHQASGNQSSHRDLISAWNYTQVVYQYLVDHGISSDRITRVSLGSALPYLEGHSQELRKAAKFNRRIDLLLQDINQPFKRYTLMDAGMPANEVTDKHRAYLSLLSGPSFRVALQEGYDLIKIMHHPDLPYPIQYTDRDVESLSIGWFSNLSAADDLRNRIRQEMNIECEVIPLFHGQQITRTQSIELSKSHPVFRRYLDGHR